jgi:hypothetical protein
MKVCDNDNLVIRWTFGETESRPTSLQAFDMLNCSVSFVKLLFPNARKVICYNSLKSNQSLKRLCEIGKRVELVESKSNFEGCKGKNSFWKYFPLRLDNSKYELVLDNDLIFWNIPLTLIKWHNSDGVLLNTDWNGPHYGEYQSRLSIAKSYNAGVIGYPPNFDFPLPDLSKMQELFHSEQGFIVKTFLESGKKVFALEKEEIFQSNSEENKLNDSSLIDDFSGGHFCGCSYGHYFDWDKHYKDGIWNEYFRRCSNWKL